MLVADKRITMTLYTLQLGIRAPTGQVIWLDATKERIVDLSTRFATNCTVAAIIDQAMFDDMPTPTYPEALAAAYSVPEGAPISMALVNLGCELMDMDAARHAKQRDNMARLR